MAITVLRIVVCVAVWTQVVAVALETTCFSLRECSGAVIAQETTVARCCLEPPPSLSYQMNDGRCLNCDQVVLEIAAVNYTVSEGDSFVELGVVKLGFSDEDVLFNIVIEQGTARAGSDYGVFPEPTIVLPTFILSNETSFTFGVSIGDDEIVENSETFVVHLELVDVPFNPPQLELGSNSRVNVSIIDDDFVDITIAQNATVLEEGDQQLMFLITREGETARNISVGALTRAVTAVAPGDFIMVDQILTFDPDEYEKVVTVFVNEDNVVEDTEGFELYLFAPEGETGVVFLRNTSLVTILDNDTLELEFSSADYSSVESDMSVSVTIVKNGENERPVTVEFSTQNGTAADSGDFVFTEQLVTFLPDDAFQTVAVQVSLDGILEEVEIFSCSLTVPAEETGVTLGRSATTVTIMDSDVVTVGVVEADITVDEGAGVVNVTVTLTEEVILGRPIVLDIGAAGISATDGEDFTFIDSPILTFDETVSERTVSIIVLEDVLFEGPEVFRVQLQTSDPGVALTTSDIEITIVDNEELLVSFSSDTYEGNETDSSVQVEATLGVEVERDVVVTFFTEDRSAKADLDYVSVSTPLTFNNVDRSHTVNIQLIDDDFSEGVEEFVVMLEHPILPEGPIAEATIRLFEDEFVFLEFNQTSYTVREGDQFVGLVIVKTGNTQQDIEFILRIVDDTAIGGRDYGLFLASELMLPVVMLSNESSFEFGILIRDDEIVENSEMFSVSLMVPQGTPGVREAEENTETFVLIEDNDVVNITMQPDNFTVVEGDFSLHELILNVSRDPDTNLDRPVRVMVFTERGTASDPEDFVAKMQILEFGSTVGSVTSHSVTIQLRDDAIVEDTEYFFVTTAPASGELGAFVLQNSSEIQILDDDVVAVQIIDLAIGAPENNSVELRVLKMGENERVVRVNVLTASGTAVESLDYNGLFFPIEFGPGSTEEVSVLIPLVGDGLVEGDETFSVFLDIPVNETGVSLTANHSTALVTIEDIDVVVIEFELSSYSTKEGEFASLVVTKSGRNAKPVMVLASVESQSATSPVDYLLLNNTVEFSPSNGQGDNDSAVILVSAVDDANYEDTLESFLVILTIPAGANDVVLGLRANASVTIEDNDEMRFGFSKDNYTVDEGSLLEVCVVKDGINDVNVDVDIFTEQFNSSVPNRAIGNLDFETVRTLITFDPSSDKLCVNLTVKSDSGQEVKEVFGVAIQSTAERAQLSPERATVFINDTTPECRVELERGTYTVSEGDGDAVVCVIKEGVSDEDIEVLVEAIVSGSDAFENTSESITFMSTVDARECIGISLNDNDVALEEDETFQVLLTVKSEACATPQLQSSVFIVDDDIVSVQFAEEVYATVETSGAVTVCVNKSQETAIPFTVILRPDGQTATAGEDFDATPQLLLFGEQTSTVCADFTIFADDTEEAPEVFSISLELPNIPGVTLGLVTNTSVTILPVVIVQFAAEVYSTTETSGVVTVCVIKNPESAIAFNVTLQPNGITATAGEDYDPTPQTVLFGQQDLTVCADFGIFADDVDEGPEIFSISLQLPSIPGLTLGPVASTTVTIIEVVVVQFAAGSYQVNETSGAVTVCVTRSQESLISFNVTLVPSGITATAVEDFDPTPQTVLFGQQGLTVCAEFGILVDDIDEGPEIFVISLELPSIPGVTLGPVANTSVTILHVPGIGLRVEFDPNVYPPVNEGEGEAVLRIVKQGLNIAQAVTVLLSTQPGTAEGMKDYIPRNMDAVTLAASDTEMFVAITIVDDAEIEPFIEYFTVSLELLPGEMNVEVGPSVQIGIVDNDQLLGNDTVVGDPLFTVPLLPTSDGQQHLMDQLPHLCYEIHGQAGSHFNLVSDLCTSVNAYYELANATVDWNVISSIGVKTVNSRGECIEVTVSADTGCTPIVGSSDGAVVTTPYHSNGISVKKYRNRVRISVPNCNRTNLVMWVTCTDVGDYAMLHFTIRRGINLSPSSHGLLGQFWNIPINFAPYLATVDSPYVNMEDLYVVTVNPSGSPSRSFVAEYYHQTWESRDDLCFYAGSYQGGSVREVLDPNDSVIEGSYRDYRVDSLFSTSFVYSQFNDSLC